MIGSDVTPLISFIACFVLSVTALAWDSMNDQLFIGGVFNAIENISISNGLAIWSNSKGLISFPTAGLSLDPYSKENNNRGGTVSNLAFEDKSGSLFVSGEFLVIGNIMCQSIAVWHRYFVVYLPSNTLSIIAYALMNLLLSFLFFSFQFLLMKQYFEYLDVPL